MVFNNLTAVLSNKRTIAENTIEMTFLVSDTSFSFKAGQYVSICIPSLSGIPIPDSCHDFSLVSSPSNPQEISIAFRVSESIFKTALLELSIGDAVNIDGPKGVLTLPEEANTPLIFVAGGIGITPLLSMVRFATETFSPQQISLLYCNSKKETTAYHDELVALEKQNQNFIMYESIGIPNEEIFAPHIKKAPNSLWCIVGAPKMVRAIRNILSGSGIIDRQILTEEFTGYDK